MALLQRPILRSAATIFFVFLFGMYMRYPFISIISHISTSAPNKVPPTVPLSTLSEHPSIAVVSMIYGYKNTLYERAIQSHQRHAARQGFPMYVLRQYLADGFWNKPTYILSILIAELAKRPEERVRWLMWVDGDTIIINPELDSDMFLPPPDFEYINYLVAKDQNGMNTGIFFLRVCDWSIKFMSKTLAYPLFRPDVDLGRSADQLAMELVANETKFQGATLYQPRIWYNTYESSHGYEGKAGRMLVHFPGMEEDRWEHMEKWLDVIEGLQAADWKLPLAQTEYPSEISRFWAELREARKALQSAESLIGNRGHTEADLVTVHSWMKEVMQYLTDDVDTVAIATEWLNEALENSALLQK